MGKIVDYGANFKAELFESGLGTIPCFDDNIKDIMYPPNFKSKTCFLSVFFFGGCLTGSRNLGDLPLLGTPRPRVWVWSKERDPGAKPYRLAEIVDPDTNL